MEAALYILSLTTLPDNITFHYDSRWAPDMMVASQDPSATNNGERGQRYILRLKKKHTKHRRRELGTAASTHNQGVDELAEQGKQASRPVGGRASLTQFAHPSSLLSPTLPSQQLLTSIHHAESATLPLLEHLPKQP